jgi:predicted phosphodiesterase
VICAGDQVDDPYNEEQYADYFSPGRLKQIPFATAVGNHDASELYRYHFHVPNESSFGRTSAGGDYWFAYGDALFMVLNTNKKDGEGKAAVRNVGEHIAFMKETLEKNQKAKWKFVVFHHSIYSAANHSQDRDIIRLRRDLVPALDALGIDVVFMGHDHSYVRTFPMKGNQPLPEQRPTGGAASSTRRAPFTLRPTPPAAASIMIWSGVKTKTTRRQKASCTPRHFPSRVSRRKLLKSGLSGRIQWK